MNNKQTGFTLIEILLALTLLSIIIVSLLSFYLNSFNMSIQVSKRIEAIYDIKQVLETYLAAEELSEGVFQHEDNKQGEIFNVTVMFSGSDIVDEVEGKIIKVSQTENGSILFKTWVTD